MAVFLFANNTATTLAGPIASGATSLSVAAGTGSLYPNPTTGQQFAITLRSQSSPGTQREIAYCTARSGDVFTIIRGQEGTTPLSFVAGDLVDNFLTAGTTAVFTQASQLQQQAGNYGVDTGAANAVAVSLSPAPASLASIVGSPIRVKISNTNTGSTTLSINSLATTVVTNTDGTNLLNGQLVSSHVFTFIYNGNTFDLVTLTEHPGFSNVRVFSSSGTFTVPSGVTKVKVRLWGGGGGGGGCLGSPAAAAGGGGGGYSEGIFTLAQSSVAIIVGAPGITPGPGSSGNGSAGGTSQFGTFCSATGGGGGGGTNSGFQTAVGSAGVGSGGYLNLAGQTGSQGQAVSATAGQGGAGGSSFGASGGPGSIGAGGGGLTPGGGNAGNANGVNVGGNAGSGLVIVEW